MENKIKPIAIVGIGCRFPGLSSSPDKFWEMLVNKTDTIRDVPVERWDNRKFYSKNDARPGKIRAKQGGFLSESVLEFDSLFFNMSPRESESLDPQQRMLLEIVYEAMEDSGMTLEAFKGSNTSVFIGGFILDNLLTQASGENKYNINSHTVAGAALTMLSNRISYVYDLKGPSLSIDTACSSSLVATHYACQSIWSGESSMALVGGANYMSSPESTILVSKGKFLSTHSRCKTFDSDAGGYVRGEGAGIVLLKPLEQALKDNDRIYATIVGTGVNQDGQTNGITVPNGDAQLKLIRKIHKDYNINKESIHYMEAHGTGTPVGDPIEFKSLNEVVSSSVIRESKCLVGSVKTNIGHLEAASGIAGLIKTALCLKHNAVPANLHFNNPNPALGYETSNLKVPTSLERLPEDEDSLASINSFGFGGTNAHIVLKQYNSSHVDVHATPLKSDHFILPVSAKSIPALKEMAAKFRKHIQENGDQFEQILSNAIYRKSSLSQRLAIFATSREDIIEKLEAYEENLLLKGVNQGEAMTQKPKIVFVYTGMGPQWWKMGRGLMETEIVFNRAVKECDDDFKEISGWSIYEELSKPMETSRVKDANIAQPANFVIQVALTRLMEYYGITPDAVVGHSVGEVASTYISGALSLKEALYVSYHRSRLQHSTAGKGAMLAVGLLEDEVLEMIKPYKDVSIAAINSPKALTLSGDSESLKELLEKIESAGAFCRLLDVTVPYHSPIMSLIKDELLDSLENIKGAETKIDLYSTVTGAKISGHEINNDYWWKNVREPVLFSKAIDTIAGDDYKIFIEIGPHPVLRNSMMECVNNSKDFYFLQTLNHKEAEQTNFFDNVSKLFTLGYPIKWDRWIEKSPYMPLPTYPWQKEYLWRESKEALTNRKENKSLFFNSKVDSPLEAYEFELNEFFFPFLNDHTVHGKVIFPGAGYIGLAIAMYQLEINQKLPLKLENIRFLRVLPVFDDEIQKLHITSNPKSGQYSIQCKSGTADSNWMEMSTGKFAVGNFDVNSPLIDLEEIDSRLQTVLSAKVIYERLRQAKLDYGPFFSCIKEIKAGNKELVAKISIHPDMIENMGDYFIHPTLLDSCFQATIILAAGEFVPVSIGKIHCYSPPGNDIICYSKLRFADENCVIADLTICNEMGKVLMRLENFKCQQLVKDVSKSNDALKGNLFQTKWIEKQLEVDSGKPAEDSVNYIITNNYSSCLLLGELLKDSIIIEPGDQHEQLNENHYQIDFKNKKSIDSLWRNNYNEINIILVFPLNVIGHPDELLTSEKCLNQIAPLLNLVKSFSESAGSRFRLNLITKGSQVVTENDIISSLEYSAIHGLARSIVNELSDCQVRLIDLEEGAMDEDREHIWKTVAAIINTGDVFYEELALRNGSVFQKKIIEREIDKDLTLKTVDFQSEALQLTIAQTAGPDGFYFESTDRIDPMSNEIEIMISNTSINYNDYLRLSHQVTDDTAEGAFSDKSLGYECVGTVTRTGSDVSRFKEGDKVLALAPGTLRTFTNTSELLAVKCPSNLTIAESNVIINYITAIYCLRDKANLRKGDKVLIHNAAGGIGLAAVYYAKYAEAEIFATAESDEGRTYLKAIGINHVFNSENLDFSTEIGEITNGKGVDVILSALSGEMLYQNFSCLAPYGAYLDISKKDTAGNSSLDKALFNHNLSHIAVDIDRMLIEKQETIAYLLNDLADYIESGCLPPLPVQVFPGNKISEAIQLIDENKVFNNVVIDFSNRAVEIVNNKNNTIKTEGTYLITGGTKGLGLEVGKWLVRNGAKNLALLSRSGLEDARTKAEVELMEKKGVKVKVYAADVSKFDELQLVFNKIKEELPELAGIFHGAMVLDDGFLIDMTEERFRNVLRPKVDGAMNLHELSKGANLDCFVLFSSISSWIGNIAQANYVAANAFLDSFAFWRKGMGLAATTINLGALAESGVVARSGNLETILEGSGINSFTNVQVLQGLDFILKERPVEVGFFNLNWSAFFKNAGKSALSLFSELNDINIDAVEEQLTEKQLGNRNVLLSLDTNLQHEFVAALLQEQLGKILKISTDHIQMDKGINLLGVDSILTIELMVVIRNNFAVEIPPIEFLTGPSLKNLSAKIINNMFQAVLA